LLVVGFIANFLVKPVPEKYYMTDVELAAERKLAHENSGSANGTVTNGTSRSAGEPLLVVIAWALVLIPISYGIWSTMQKAWGLFH
jgi:hypothetical protein